MRNNIKIILATLLAFIAAATLVTSQKVSSYSSFALVNQEQNDESQIPVTDYSIPEPTDNAERAKRKDKSLRYHSTGNRIKEEPRVSLITNSESLIEWIPSLPASLSHIVIIGDVTNAQAYLTDDKSAIYSEFTIHIEEVLKSSGDISFSLGTNIIAEREGGGVRFPSGHIQHYVVSGERMPKVGNRYALFLKSNGTGQDFTLLRGYELRAGKVFPLDGFRKDAVYKDMDQDVFISKVRSVITSSSQNAPEKVRESQ